MIRVRERIRYRFQLVAATTAVLCPSVAATAGNLNPPPGPITPTMKTLDQVEPRVLVQSLPGSGTALHEISESGSYYLAGNLTGESGKNGIDVQAPDVTIDLNGFVMTGGAGSLAGIAGSTANVTVRNGSLRQWGDSGIALSGDFCQAVDVTAMGNGVDGIQLAGRGTTVRDCRAVGNGENGIEAGEGAMVTDCTAVDNALRGILGGRLASLQRNNAFGNSGTGIAAGERSVVSLNAANENDGTGIFVDGTSATVVHCTTSGNGNTGISAGGGPTVSECTASDNGENGIRAAGGSIRGCTASDNGENGILGSTYGMIADNTCHRNGDSESGAGIFFRRSNRVESNHVTENTTGLSTGSCRNYVDDNIVLENDDNYEFLADCNHLNLLISEVPESIDWRASVKLAGSMFGDSNADGLTVNSDDVTVDLAGHALLGNDNTGDGVTAIGSDNLSVRNGTLRFWSDGVNTSELDNSRARNLRIFQNSRNGLLLGDHSRVSDCVASDNGTGIDVGDGSTVEGCVSAGNDGGGIDAGSSTVVARCATQGNGHIGVDTQENSVVATCTAGGNGSVGISVSGAADPDGGVVTACSARGNTLEGISIREGVVTNSACVANNRDGLFGDNSLLRGNAVLQSNEDNITSPFSRTLENHTD